MQFETDLWLAGSIIGIGATLIMDIWAYLLNRFLKIPSMDYGLLGRWFLYMKDGRLTHNTILATLPKPLETPVGWWLHYVVGVIFGIAFLAMVGSDWVKAPTILPPILFGMASVLFPYFIMQPCFGFGLAAAKTPAPKTARFKSLMAHTSFGLGLYLSGVLFGLIPFILSF